MLSVRNQSHRVLRPIVIAGGLLVTACASAVAQEPPATRVVAFLDLSAQITTSTVQQSVTFEQYSEQGSLNTSYTVPRRPVFGGGLAVRVWRQFGVAIGADHMSDSGSAQVTALLPDPFTFNNPHMLSGSAPVSRIETAVYLNAAFWPYRSPALDVRIEGGASLVRVDQDFVSDVNYSQPPPYTTVTYEGATVVREHQNVTGGNIAGDVTWRFAHHVGVGGILRYSHAHALFSDSGAPALVAGGLRVGAGIRVNF
jgi:hypothetical protein